MTGFGEARRQDDRIAVVAELRAVNHRHLKLSIRISEPYSAIEPDLERLIREHVRRGSVQLNLRVERPKRPEDYRLNPVALTSYLNQLQALRDPKAPPLDLADLLVLPGIVEDRRGVETEEVPEEDWPILLAAVNEAIEKFQVTRNEEGRAMAEELATLGQSIAEHLERVSARGPKIVAAYQDRLLERVQALVQDQVVIEPKDLIREVAIFADRSDIAEEVTRLRAHLDQFVATLNEPESSGRKLEFIAQEMGRETNTIGSKASDVEVSREVVAIKGLLEKIRELIQNVE